MLSYKVKVKIDRRGLFNGTLAFEKVVEVAKRNNPTVNTPWESIPKVNKKSFLS